MNTCGRIAASASMGEVLGSLGHNQFSLEVHSSGHFVLVSNRGLCTVLANTPSFCVPPKVYSTVGALTSLKRLIFRINDFLWLPGPYTLIYHISFHILPVMFGYRDFPFFLLAYLYPFCSGLERRILLGENSG